MKLLIMTLGEYCREIQVDKSAIPGLADKPDSSLVVYDDASKEAFYVEPETTIMVTSAGKLRAVKEPFSMKCDCEVCRARQEPKPAAKPEDQYTSVTPKGGKPS